jgi:CRP-like cAMP-binding protein
MNVREKLCHYLNEEAKRQKTSLITLPLSRQTLADNFGIQKYSLQRCLNELKEEGIIDFQGKAIHILKPLELIV